MTMYGLIQYEETGNVATISLNRPDKLNALSYRLMEEMINAIERCSRNPAMKVLIVKGNGRAFSAGVDLKETQSQDFNQDKGILRLGYRLDQLIRNLPIVTIAQVHGYCFTGALELVLMFDLIYCTHSAYFSDTHAKWAIMPRWGMTQRLSRRIGLHRAKEMTFTARRISGEMAQEIGLVNASFDDQDIEAKVRGVIEEITANDKEAIGRIKQLYNEGYSTTLAKGLEIELAADPNLSSTAGILENFDKKKKQ